MSTLVLIELLEHIWYCLTGNFVYGSYFGDLAIEWSATKFPLYNIMIMLVFVSIQLV